MSRTCGLQSGPGASGRGFQPSLPGVCSAPGVTKPVRPPASPRLASLRGVQTRPALRLPSAWQLDASGVLGPARVAPGRFTEAGPGTGWGSEWPSLNERWLVSRAEPGGAGSGSPGATSRPGACRPSRPDSTWASATLLVPSLPSGAQSAWSQETLPVAKGIKRRRGCPVAAWSSSVLVLRAPVRCCPRPDE